MPEIAGWRVCWKDENGLPQSKQFGTSPEEYMNALTFQQERHRLMREAVDRMDGSVPGPGELVPEFAPGLPVKREETEQPKRQRQGKEWMKR